jgi:hypothetical protein
MPLTPDDDNSLKALHGKLAGRSLDPDSPFYEPIHTVLDDDDPVWLMQRQPICSGCARF